MLKFSTYTSAWILTILLLVASVIRTQTYNNIDTVNPPKCCHYHNYCYQQYYEPLKNSDSLLLNLTHILRDFISVFLNGTCVYDPISLNNRLETNIPKDTAINDLKRFQRLLKNKLKSTPIFPEAKSMPNAWINTLNDYVNDTPVFNNILPKSIKGPKKNRKNYIGYKWRRRTLCAIVDEENYSSESIFKNKIFSNADKAASEDKKTLLDYDAPVFMNDIDDSDSLKAHVRVKRSNLEHELFVDQRDYLKDLANSFPQNSYDSIDESSYDDDASFDTKRETKSQEFFVNDEQLNDPPDGGERSKMPNVYSPMIPAYVNNEKSGGSNFIGAPSDAVKANTFEDQTENQHLVSLGESKNNKPVINQRTCENLEEQNLPEDPMLAVELVRIKRDDDAKIPKERGLENRALSDFQDTVDQSEKSSNKEKTSVLAPGKYGGRLSPSDSVAANLKAELLRIRRKVKENRHKKGSKLKKKKKHSGKKNNVSRNTRRLAKDIRLKDTERSRVARERKKNDAKKEGKSKVGIASLVSRKNNGNNFRRRSKKAKKSIERTETENEYSSKNVVSARNEKVERGVENKIDTDNPKLSLVARKRSMTGSDESNVVGLDESTNAFLMQGGKQEPSIGQEQPMESLDDTVIRSKRAKDNNHGFLSKEDELRYYENIREPGSEMDRCTDQKEDQFSVSNKMDGNRAVRSIEEVKELAKKLVTKVNELQNYLSIEEAANNDSSGKKIETRAIDDLCSNVSTACDAFKETPKIVQKCVSTTSPGGTAAKIVERNVDPVVINTKKKFAKGRNKKSVEKKRSVGSRAVKIPPRTLQRTRKQDELRSNHKWGKWTDWSSCSVTCGKGRQIRWRYCLHDCSTAETEMEEKACQLPACPPGKFLGIF